jgi:hypothetical protein
MEDLRLQAVAARVAAWHNKHPLARRITPAQVHSIGYVALPFSGAAPAAPSPVEPGPDAAAPAGGSLRERALARARGEPQALAAMPPSSGPAPALAELQAAFSEDLIAPIGPRQVAAWARRQGRLLTAPPSDGPVRVVAAGAGVRTWPVYVMTAAIDLGALRSRVLVGAGERAAVLGPRLWSRPRLGVLAVVALAVPALALGLVLGRAQPGAHGQAVAASAAASAAASTPASAAVAHAVPASAADAVQAADAAAPAIDVEPRAGRVTLPPLGPVERAAGRPASAAALAASAPPATLAAAHPATEPPPPDPTPKRATPAPPAAAAVRETAATSATATTTTSGAFALSTRPLRTRAEAEQVMAAMAALLLGERGVGMPPVKVEILPEGLDWRVVGWAYAARPEAEKARALLVARGMRVEVIAF